MENLHFHDLRHEATSRLFEKGLNPVEVATITGHKDTRMLMRYTHLRAEDLVGRLGGLANNLNNRVCIVFLVLQMESVTRLSSTLY
jgi:integrase